MRRNTITMCLMFIGLLLHGQIEDEIYFGGKVEYPAEEVQKSIRHKGGIIAQSVMLEETEFSNSQFFLFKADVEGNVIWSTLRKAFLGVLTNSNPLTFDVMNDGYLYAVTPEITDVPGLWRINFLYKIDPDSGQVIYNVPVDLFEVYDYDEDYLIGRGDDHLALIERETGEIEYLPFEFSFNPANLVVDEAKNIYVSDQQNIYKFNQSDVTAILWSLELDEVEEMNKVYLDAYDDLYLLVKDEDDNSHTIKVDKDHGVELWSTRLNSQSQDTRLSDFQDDGDYFYSCYRHVYVGSIDPYYSASKLNKETGQVEWMVDYKINELMINGEGPINRNQAARALEIDCEGNVYLAGYYGNSGYGPGLTGVMKLDGNTGDRIYDLTITNNFDMHDGESVPRDIFIQNDTLYVVSTQQTIDFGKAPYVTSLNPFDGTEYAKNQISVEGNECASLSDIDAYFNGEVHTGELIENQFRLLRPNDMDNQIQLRLRHHTAIDKSLIYTWDERKFVAIQERLPNDQNMIFVYTGTEDLYSFDVDSFPIGEDDVLEELIIWGDHYGVVTNEDNNQVVYIIEEDESTNTRLVLETDVPRSSSEAKIKRFMRGGFRYAGKNEVKIFNVSSPFTLDFSVPYTQPMAVYGNDIGLGNIYLCGSSEDNQPIVNSLSFSTQLPNWTTVFPFEGIAHFLAIERIESNVYTAGVSDGNMFVSRLNEFGEIDWLYNDDVINLENTVPLDLAIDYEKNTIAIAAKQYEVDGSSDGLLLIFNMQGSLIFIERYPSELGAQNEVVAIENQPDDRYVFGGKHHTEEFGKQGFIAYANVDGVTLDLGVSGVVYYDENQNKIQDAGEYGLADENIVIDVLESDLLTDIDGQYFIRSVVGDKYNIQATLDDSWTLTTDSMDYTVTYDPMNPDIFDRDFGFYKELEEDQAVVNLSSDPTRCNTVVNFKMRYGNAGELLEDVRVELILDPRTTLVDIFPEPDEIISDPDSEILVWNQDTIHPFQNFDVLIDLAMASEQSTGESLCYLASVFKNDEEEALNTFEYKPVVLCSYDPNDKLVTPAGIGEEGFTLFGDSLLNYTVRFQNTGNDFAQNIKILDTLDANLDIETFKVTNSSFPVRTTIDGRAVEFFFADIYLQDSLSNEPASHGFVSYEIKLNSDVSDNTLIENTAYIIFDFNPPIITNTTQSTMVDLLPVSVSEKLEQEQLQLFPNPTTGKFRLVLEGGVIDNTFNAVLRNSLGSKVQSNTDGNFDISEMTDGIYFVELEYEGRKYVCRLVKI